MLPDHVGPTIKNTARTQGEQANRLRFSLQWGQKNLPEGELRDSRLRSTVAEKEHQGIQKWEGVLCSGIFVGYVKTYRCDWCHK